MSGKNYSCANTGKRNKKDFYQTPYCLTEKLLEYEYFDKGRYILEPACGKGAIIYVLEKYWESGALEYYDKSWNEDKYSFFNENRNFPYIITNPPYSIANDFIKKGLEVYTDKMAMLLPLDYLQGQKRFEDDIFRNLTKVHIFTRMPLLSETIREDGLIEKTGMQPYAWFIWEKKYTAHPEIDWIDIKDCIYRKGR